MIGVNPPKNKKRPNISKRALLILESLKNNTVRFIPVDRVGDAQPQEIQKRRHGRLRRYENTLNCSKSKTIIQNNEVEDMNVAVGQKGVERALQVNKVQDIITKCFSK